MDNSTEKVNEYKALTKEEEHQLLVEFNQTKVEYNKNNTIHKLFEEQVNKTPNNIAVVYEEKELIYKELNEKANQLAHHLIEQGVQADDLIAICVDRSLEMMIGLLAILKSGGAYVPIDPNYPDDRIEYMVTNSNAKVLLTQESIKNTLPKTNSMNICIDTFNVSNYQITNTKTDTKSNNLAYVIYTSGSTGRPKGVMVEHRNLDRLLQSTYEKFLFSSKDVWTFFHSFAFDFAVWEIWGALLHGAKLVIVPFDISRSPDDFYKLILKEKVTILNQTPSAFKQLISVDIKNKIKISTLRKVIFGGEKLDFKSLSIWLDKYSDSKPKLINMYGITETTIHSTYYEISKDDLTNDISIIGNMLNDLSFYILDKNDNLVPKGVAGELHISGDGLARGYLNQPELTDEKFIENPFIKNTRMYKTGDLVKYLEDGNIQYIGRIDDQVKIRGFRIELGEIEQQLLLIEQIKESVVIAKEDSNGYKSLVGYIIVNEEINLQEIKFELSKHLPDYMVPSAIVIIDTLPLTPNGKTDKKALAKLDVNIESTHEYVAPRDELEEKLAMIFSEVLNIEKVGIHDDFFELGGNSLLSVSLISKINKLFNTELKLVVLFQASSIEQINLLISSNSYSSNILVPIQTKGNKTPIFALFGPGASPIVFQPLANALGDTQPFYGIDGIGKRKNISRVCKYEELAKKYIIAIKLVQPNGPYNIIGFCFGAPMAYEISRLIPDEIKSIILISAYSPTKSKTTLGLLKNSGRFLLYKTKAELEKLEYFTNNKTITKFITKYSKTKTTRYNRISYDFYKPKKLKEKLNISTFCIKNSHFTTDNEYIEEYGWNNLIDNKIKVVLLNTHHENILSKGYANTLSNNINAYYNSIQ